MDSTNLAESAMYWDPLYQKRSELGRQSPGGYTYFGPPPDAGTSYGSWWDPAGYGVIAPITQDTTALYSPVTGTAMEFEGVCSDDMLAAVLSYKGEFELLPATQTGHTCLTTAKIFKHACPALFNPFTGEEITQEYKLMKTNKEAAAAKTKTQAASKMELVGPGMGSVPNSVSKPDLKATGLPKLDASKPVDHKSADKGKDKLSKSNGSGSDEKESEKKVKPSSIKPVHDVKIPDMSKAAKAVDQMSDEELLDAVEAELATANEEGFCPPGSEGLKITVKEEEEGEEKAAPDMSSETSLDLSLEEEGKLGEGLSTSPEGAPPVPGAPPAAPGMEDDSIPLLHEGSDMEGWPMPMASANKQLVAKLKSTAAALRAGVAVDEKELQSLMAKAAGIVRAGKGVTKTPAKTKAEAPQSTDATASQLQKLTDIVAKLVEKVNAMDMPMPPPAGGPPAGPGLMPPAGPLAKGEGEEEEMSAPPDMSAPPAPEGMPPAPPAPSAPPAGDGGVKTDEMQVEEIMQEDEKAEGVHFEVLQSMDDIEKEGISADAIDCRLYAAGSANPFWNVSVHGEPLARIDLQSQDRPEEIKALFVSPTYGETIAKASAMVKGGLRAVLASSRARYFALKVDKTEIGKRIEASVKADADKVVAEKLGELQNKFIECMATAAIGFDRNFFPGGNPLKDSFFQVLSQFGVENAKAVRIIEAAFADGSAPYFKALAQQATKLMDMEKTAFNQVRATILEAGVVMPVVEAAAAQVDPVGKTMSQFLTEASLNMEVLASQEEPMSERDKLASELGFPRKQR